MFRSLCNAWGGICVSAIKGEADDGKYEENVPINKFIIAI